MRRVPSLVVFALFIILSITNTIISLKILRDPNPFPSSYWDLPWAIIFAIAFTLVGILYLFSSSKLMLYIAVIGLAVSVIIPVFTIGVGTTYIFLTLIMLISIASGNQLLRLLQGKEIENKLERYTLSVLVGLGLIMILVSIQGALQAFNPVVTWIGLGVLTLVFVMPNIKGWIFVGKEWVLARYRSAAEGDTRYWALALIILIILWLPSWFIGLAPAIRYDEITYHLAGSSFYLRQGGIVPFPEGGTNVWLHYADMLYTLALQIAGQPLPRLFHLLMGMVSTILVYMTGRRLINERVGIISAILFSAVPVINYEASTAYIDLFVTAYTLGFGYAVLSWWLERNPRWLLTAGVLGGIGLGSKLTAGPIIAGLIILLIFATLTNASRLKNFLWIAVMIGLIIVIALPWLVRDAVWTGDPFYPFGISMMQKMTPSSSGITTEQPTVVNKIVSFIKYPWEIVFNSFKFYTEAPGGMVSPLPLLAAPFFIFSSCVSKRVKAFGLAVLFACGVALAIMFLTNIALVRYAFPIFPYLAICAAVNAEVIYCNLYINKSRSWQTLVVIFSIIYLFSTRIPLIIRNADILPERFPVSYIIGRETRDEYLSENLAVYEAFRFIDSQTGTPHRVLSIGNEFRFYVQSRIDGVYDVPQANKILSAAQTPKDLQDLLIQNGYDFILINQPEAEYRWWKYIDPYPILKDLNTITSYFELVFAKKGIYVYSVYPSMAGSTGEVNLLQNSGFEEWLGENDTADWDEEGVVEKSHDSQLGDISLLLNAPQSKKGYGYVYQRVLIEEEKIYTLSYYLKSDAQAIFLKQIRWLDHQGNIISREEFWENTNSDWRWYSLSSQAPRGALHAVIYASLGGSENALVDAICFSYGQTCTSP